MHKNRMQHTEFPAIVKYRATRYMMSIISMAAQKKDDIDCIIKDKVKCNSGTKWNLVSKDLIGPCC